MNSTRITSKTTGTSPVLMSLWKSCEITIFLLKKILETPQMHGLNSNHYPSNKICSPFSQTSSLKSLLVGPSTKSRHLWLSLSFYRNDKLTNQFFHNVPNFVFYIHPPQLPNIRSSFLSTLAAGQAYIRSRNTGLKKREVRSSPLSQEAGRAEIIRADKWRVVGLVLHLPKPKCGAQGRPQGSVRKYMALLETKQWGAAEQCEEKGRNELNYKRICLPS